MAFKDFNVPDPGSQQAPVVNQEKTNPNQSLIDRILGAKEQIAIINALGGAVGGQGGAPPQNQNDIIAATVVNKSIEALQKNNESTQSALGKKDEEIAKERAESDKAKEVLYGTMAGQITGALDRLEKVRDELAAKQKPFAEQLKEYQDVSRILFPQQPQQSPAVTAPQQDGQISLALEQMRMNHELTMKKMDMELSRMNQELQIRLAEFTDSRNQKKQEYEDSKAFRGNAVNAVSDIAASVAAAIGGSKGGVAAKKSQQNQPPQEHPGAKQDEQIVPNFVCEECGTKLAVPKGKPFTCPTCKTSYEPDNEDEE
jgi:hypothetical protein